MTQPYLFDFFGSEAQGGDRRRAPDRATPLEINPYRVGGLRPCRHGLGDCGSGGRRPGVRRGIAAALGRALDSGRAAGRILALGTRSDPYQPLEAEFGLTREIVKELALRRGWTITLRSMSPLLRRDIDLLREVDGRNRLRVQVPLMSLDQGLLTVLQPEAPPAAERLLLLRDLRRWGIAAGLSISPVIPGLTDSLGSLEDLVRAARRCGARFVEWSPLALEPAPQDSVDRRRPSSTEILLSRVRAVAPLLAGRLERICLGRDQAPPFCNRLIATRMRELGLKYGFGQLEGGGFAPPPARGGQALPRL